MVTKKPATKKAVKKSSVATAIGVNKADEARWRAESDLRVIQQMAELKADPARLRMVEQMLKQQAAALTKVKGALK